MFLVSVMALGYCSLVGGHLNSLFIYHIIDVGIASPLAAANGYACSGRGTGRPSRSTRLFLHG